MCRAIMPASHRRLREQRKDWQSRTCTGWVGGTAVGTAGQGEWTRTAGRQRLRSGDGNRQTGGKVVASRKHGPGLGAPVQGRCELGCVLHLQPSELSLRTGDEKGSSRDTTEERPEQRDKQEQPVGWEAKPQILAMNWPGPSTPWRMKVCEGGIKKKNNGSQPGMEERERWEGKLEKAPPHPRPGGAAAPARSRRASPQVSHGGGQGTDPPGRQDSLQGLHTQGGLRTSGR